VERATGLADLIELRLDCLIEPEFAEVSQEIAALLASEQPPLILTLRPAEQGGPRTLDIRERLRFRLENISRLWGNVFWDVELDLAIQLQELQGRGNGERLWQDPVWKRTICSYHDFGGVPEDLENIYERLAATPACILKVAVQANDITDCIPVFRLLERAQREGREMIAIAMGQAGMMTRVLGPARGSFLTYGSLDDESATAPGQLTAKTLREVYRIDRIDHETEIMGLMGRPVAHSISPQMQNAGFKAADVNAVYIPLEVSDADGFMRLMVNPRSREIEWNLRGLSITAPHKAAVMAHLDWIEPSAREIGAVNTIVIEGSETRGYNTDAAAFIAPLQRAIGSLNGKRCAIIGAGGAARSAIWALRREGASVSLLGRSIESAKPLAAEHGLDAQPLQNASLDGFDVLINATPVGTRGDHENATPAVAGQLRGVRLVYDLVYNPLETQLMREARLAGCEALGGLEMLIAQAVAQFQLWIGKQPDVAAMRQAAERALT
jgi:3-dehydroquinate dehydratase/shikimate dehydrogenase